MAKRSAARKISVSIPAEELAWAKTVAKREHTSLSSVLARALRAERQMQARQRVVEKLGIRATPEEREAVRREWRG